MLVQDAKKQTVRFFPFSSFPLCRSQLILLTAAVTARGTAALIAPLSPTSLNLSRGRGRLKKSASTADPSPSLFRCTKSIPLPRPPPVLLPSYLVYNSRSFRRRSFSCPFFFPHVVNLPSPPSSFVVLSLYVFAFPLRNTILFNGNPPLCVDSRERAEKARGKGCSSLR